MKDTTIANLQIRLPRWLRWHDGHDGPVTHDGFADTKHTTISDMPTRIITTASPA